MSDDFTYGHVFVPGEFGDQEITVTMTLREACAVGLAFNGYVMSGMFTAASLEMLDEDQIAGRGFQLALMEVNARFGAVVADLVQNEEHRDVFAGSRAWLEQQKAEWRDAA